MGRRGNGFIDITELTERELARVGGAFGRVVTAFAAAVGPELSRVATPVSLRRGTLRIRCASASWAQTVGFMERELLERLAAAGLADPIERIHAVAGASPLPQPPPPPRPGSDLVPLDAATCERLEGMVASLPEGPVRQSVLAAATAAERRRRSSP